MSKLPVALASGEVTILESELAKLERDALAWRSLVDKDVQAKLQEDAQKWRSLTGHNDDQSQAIVELCLQRDEARRRLDEVEERARKKLEALRQFKPDNWQGFVKDLCEVMGWQEPEWVKK